MDETFQEYQRKGKFIVIRFDYNYNKKLVENIEKTCHKIVLCKNSKYFLNKFTNDSASDIITETINVDSYYFIKELCFMYNKPI